MFVTTADYKISRSKKLGYAAYIYDRSMIRGRPTILLGGAHGEKGKLFMRAAFRQLEDNIDYILSHEFIHALLYDLEGLGATKAWDRVDNQGQITW